MNGIKPDPDIKADPDAITPSGSGYMDDDFYEDTGELSLPPKGSNKDVWVTRIPKWLYEAVSKWSDHAEGKDDDQIVIGEVLAMQDEARRGISKTQPMRLFLNEKWQAKKQLPQAFEIKMTDSKDAVLGNTYIFTEKDLPGYKPSVTGGNRQGGAGGHHGIQDPQAKVFKRSKYKKAIPKQTALLGTATREYNASPLNTPEFAKFNKARTMAAIQGRESKVNIVDNLHDHTASQDVQKMFNSFIKSTAKQKTQLNKAARIPRNDLIDLLHSCFDEYAYWPMKQLKAKTKQPEAYLKEVLSEIADLVKAGSFASCWRRNPIYNKTAEHDGLPPDTVDPDDDEEMEDVV
ncbi:hypothetical protein BU24DRAFT_233675 [Aaosphaeria arxii CBS 175.79]|uniref:Transcription initiation factor IIF subunit beta n=1 Tax=Aaosphaeria arxii CBS 175.79 TaxID=1450172 RepID=A0A6A5XKL0_9PLEO|nr:uncharacterized protein BU24DRAFT_233675 [Aaosphaeria arxii CBS 175.79]KAF2013270.1 hypothetical protein BU24DRAFT_233675 [Aaosphaeria arxii CBS 175.79]